MDRGVDGEGTLQCPSTLLVTVRHETPVSRGSALPERSTKKVLLNGVPRRSSELSTAMAGFLCQSFLRFGLVDEIRLAVMPVLLGDGPRPFGNSSTETRWRLKDVVASKTGIVELSYGRESSGG
jgi:dihydrofolate reductase